MVENIYKKTYKRMFTHHGEKRNQGELCIVNGSISLGYIENGKLIGFTTIEEMMQEACSRKLNEYTFK